jgi:hypothetical protein
MGVSIKKTVALVLALAKVHNFCINCMTVTLLAQLPLMHGKVS